MGVWMLMAAVIAACAVRLRHARPTLRGLRRSRSGEPCPRPSAALVLGMVEVAIRQGASIPVAVAAVGDAVGGGVGARMRMASRSLRRGVAWDEAWLVPCADDVDAGEVAGNAADTGEVAGDAVGGVGGGGTADDAECLRLLRDALAESWRYGASPSERLRAAMESLDRDERAAIERHASRLSVRLLAPTGLCFLPAFIVIGVIPSIVSFL